VTLDRGFVLRLVGLGVIAVIVQIAAVSQITVLGVSADITPLVVMSIGLLAGSLPGAVMGFAMGLFVDMALVQTLGVTSLVLMAVGYGSGRLRELRDASHGLLPLAVGLAASAATTLGFSVFQFLLGIDAPVSFLLVRQMLAVTLLGGLLSLPVYRLVLRLVASRLPDDPRRRSRRRAPTGGLSPLSSSSPSRSRLRATR
jgi:rod shape-determining protein MreD